MNNTAIPATNKSVTNKPAIFMGALLLDPKHLPSIPESKSSFFDSMVNLLCEGGWV